MRMPRRLVWEYHPLANGVLAAFMLVLGVLSLSLKHAPGERWWFWLGACVVGLLCGWLAYARFPTGEEPLGRAFRRARDGVPWWRTTIACLWVLLISLSVVTENGTDVICIGMTVGFLAWLPWWWRRWRAMKEAWDRWGASEATGTEAETPGSSA
jgi:hypothetical protein